MVRFISLHSFKGGTGKTTLASNLAVLNALSGQNVCLLDFDFRAPGLQAVFRVSNNLWLNDFLDGKTEFAETLNQIEVDKDGRLVVGFANPSTEAMRDMMTKDREWEARALHRVLSAKAFLAKEGYDIVIFDTSPGIQYSSINALAASNVVLSVMNRDELYREDIVNLINNIYRPLGHTIGIALNKVLISSKQKAVIANGSDELNELKEMAEQRLGCPIYGVIPCFCEVLKNSYEVYVIRRPDHPFVAAISTLADNIKKNI
jgi:MinD-like ATPase involved in chromosome partitioning or flagellar assembly